MAQVILRGFHPGGLLLGTLFLALSLTPTLLPREDAVQGVISGLSLAVGYGVAVAIHAAWVYLQLPRVGERVHRAFQWLALVVCAGFAVFAFWRASDWQNALRALMGMEETAIVQPVVVGLVALGVFLAALAVARLFILVFLFISERLKRVISARAARLAGLLLAFVAFWAVVDGVLFAWALRVTDATHQQIDALMEPEFERPTEPLRAGSAESLIGWEEVGRHGRRFLSAGPTPEEIAAFTGGDDEVPTPIRVYVGLNNAETPEERAELALKELQRVDAFERSVLVLATPTGTGWVDRAAINPLEHLHRGDTATVAAQYSYLPSPFALVFEGDYGVEQARAMFDVIYGYWSALPEDQRPELYLYGLSLGALNSDRSFDLFDIIDDPFQGTLWSGMPFRSETLQTVTQRREAGSPAWRPRFRGGSVVRFMNQDGGLEDATEDWGTYRMAFLQYASDPVTFFDPQSFYREPEWMQEPRGPDVSDDLRWFPAVTMLQLLADLTAGASPTGYGHDYAAEHYHDAWIALTEPEGWSEEELRRLREHWEEHTRRRIAGN